MSSPTMIGRNARCLKRHCFGIEPDPGSVRDRNRRALVGATDHGTTKAVYGRDPDGLEFEMCRVVAAERIDDDLLQARAHRRPLDRDAEIERYGATT